MNNFSFRNRFQALLVMLFISIGVSSLSAQCACTSHSHEQDSIVTKVSFTFSNGEGENVSKVKGNLLLKSLQSNPDAVVEITGWADASGSDSACKEMSKTRANAVSNYLIAAGIDPKRIIVTGMGVDSKTTAKYARRADAKVYVPTTHSHE